MFILLLCLIFMTIISYFTFNRDLICPSVLFNFGFTCAAFCAYLYENIWGFQGASFYKLVLGSSIAFFLGSVITYYLNLLKFNNRQIINKTNLNIHPVNINTISIFIYIIFQCIFIMLNIHEMNLNVHIGNDITEKVGIYYELKRQKLLIYQVPFLNMFRVINTSVIYYVIYTVLTDVILKNKTNRLSLVLIFLGFVFAYLTGTRTEIFMYLISSFVMYIILLRYSGNVIKINIKYILISLGMLILFNVFAIIQGRIVQNMTSQEVFVTYLGAPLKNLELFINNSLVSSSNFFGEATFNGIYKIFNINLNQIYGLYEYRFINGKGLGNVASLLAPIYYDFGVYGGIIIVFLVGMISQLIYNGVIFKKNEHIKISTLVYSLTAFAITFSFFSNKFFEIVIAKTMIYFIIGIYASHIYFTKLNMVVKSKK